MRHFPINRPFHARASLSLSCSCVDRAINPPDPLPVVERKPAVAPLPARQATPEDWGRALAQIAKALEPVVLFFQRVGRGYREGMRG